MFTQSVLVVLIILTIDVYCSTMDLSTNKSCAGEIDHTITQSSLVSNDHLAMSINQSPYSIICLLSINRVLCQQGPSQ